MSAAPVLGISVRVRGKWDGAGGCMANVVVAVVAVGLLFGTGACKEAGTTGGPALGTGGATVEPGEGPEGSTGSGGTGGQTPAPAFDAGPPAVPCTTACAAGERCVNGLCAPCGGVNQPCCAGPTATACGMGNRCVNQGQNLPSLCLACGAMGQVCCLGSMCTAPLGCTDNGTAGTCGVCGGPGQACCAGVNKCEAGNRCTDNPMGGGSLCQPCGGMGQACCAMSTCTAPLACADTGSGAGTCGTCGGTGQPCCNVTGQAARCQEGNRCSDPGMGAPSMCQPCGGMGQTCCSGSMCAVPLGCADTGGPGTCGMCGKAGQACCNGDTECSEGYSCIDGAAGAAASCQQCGGRDQPCCDGSTCKMGLGCNDTGPGPGTCTNCGTRAGATCCGGNHCQMGLVCAGGNGGGNGGASTGMCATCGGSGQICCENQTCGNATLRCVDSDAGPRMCQPCGKQGQVCCRVGGNNVCNGNLDCRLAGVAGGGRLCLQPLPPSADASAGN